MVSDSVEVMPEWRWGAVEGFGWSTAVAIVSYVLCGKLYLVGVGDVDVEIGLRYMRGI